MEESRGVAPPDVRPGHAESEELLPRDHSVLPPGDARDCRLDRNNSVLDPAAQLRQELCVTYAHNSHLEQPDQMKRELLPTHAAMIPPAPPAADGSRSIGA